MQKLNAYKTGASTFLSHNMQKIGKHIFLKEKTKNEQKRKIFVNSEWNGILNVLVGFEDIFTQTLKNHFDRPKLIFQLCNVVIRQAGAYYFRLRLYYVPGHHANT